MSRADVSQLIAKHEMLRLAEQRLNEHCADMVVTGLLGGLHAARNELLVALGRREHGLAVIATIRAELVEEAFPGRAVSEGT